MARAVILFDDIVVRVAETGYRVLTFNLHREGWVLHIAKVGSIPSPYLRNVEEQKS